VLKRNLLCFTTIDAVTRCRTLGFCAVLLSLSACKAPEVCEELGTCGGDVVGTVDHDGDGVADRTWDIAGSCTNQISSDPPNTSLINQPTTPAGQRPPQPEYVNWCSEMVIDQGTKKVSKIIPWYPAIPIGTGSIFYSADGTYKTNINYSANQTVEFAAGCFQSQGYTIVPAGTQSTSNTMTCEEFTGYLADGLMTEDNITGITCGDDGQNGCACIYNLLLVTGPVGTYTIEGSVIHHFDVTKLPESSADFCVVNDQLQLTGHDRQFLFNQPNIRSLVLSGE
jgi:hypothetical protein